MRTVVADDASDVQSVVYTVYVPAGVSLSHLTITGGPLRDKETVVVAPESSNGGFDVVTTVTTGTSAAVSVTVTIPGVETAVTTGVSGDDLLTSVGG